MFFSSHIESRMVKISLKKVLKGVSLHIIIFKIINNLTEPTKSHLNGI